ncbi:hypothetical protein G5I_14292 [Acromyrmex echinatior]|uniref:Uncharacterized protein n=1 Tax=Acromyrmex echinatior TaxID=103372 RepID=F4X702_ACREC|nr:hypothetical protein G5I_14292 [Acromyrmex echinatior]
MGNVNDSQNGGVNGEGIGGVCPHKGQQRGEGAGREYAERGDEKGGEVAGAVQGSPVEADDGAEGRATSWVVGGKREKTAICMSETGRRRAGE